MLDGLQCRTDSVSPKYRIGAKKGGWDDSQFQLGKHYSYPDFCPLEYLCEENRRISPCFYDNKCSVVVAVEWQAGALGKHFTFNRLLLQALWRVHWQRNLVK